MFIASCFCVVCWLFCCRCLCLFDSCCSCLGYTDERKHNKKKQNPLFYSVCFALWSLEVVGHRKANSPRQKKKNKYSCHLFSKKRFFFSAEKALGFVLSSFFLFVCFFCLLEFGVPFWQAVQGPQNGPTIVQIGFWGSQLLTKIVPKCLTS